MTTTETPTATTPKTHSGDAGFYLILEGGADDTWSVRNKGVKASSADGALRRWLAQHDKAGTYLAVPVRNWRPRMVTVETVSRVKLS